MNLPLPPLPKESALDPRPPFVVDTSAWIQAYNEDYTPDVFERLYHDLAGQLRHQAILLPEMVYVELRKRNDGLKKWIEKFESHVTDHDQAVETQAAAIRVRFPYLVNKAKMEPRSLADAAIIATAIVKKASVITKEGWAGKETKAKIPNVCDHYDVPWFRLIRMYRHFGFKYSA